MLFNSLIFWLFSAVFFPAYFFTRGRHRLWVCLIASYIFYAWWDWRFLGLIVGLTILNYWLGLFMDTAAPAQRRVALIASIAASLCVLGFFKYANFFIESIFSGLAALGFNGVKHHLEIILPIGISFYTFQAMSYTIDLYRRKIPVERSLLRFATFKAFFPQLVAGPIVRAATFLPQLYRDASWDWNRIIDGICMVAWGFVLKVVLADSLASVVDFRFANHDAVTALSMAIGVLCYAFQIYGDFAGYSLIAIGLAHICGFDFGINFDRPYFSTSFSEFWHRWHISLSSWLRDYLYIPLGGNRKGSSRTYFNLLATMVLGGLWHGASWTFVIWGLLHGVYLCVQRIFVDSVSRKFEHLQGPARTGISIANMAVVFFLICIAWVFFRAQNVGEALAILERIATQGNWSFSAVEQRFNVVKGLILVTFIVAVEGMSFKVDYRTLSRKHPFLIGLFLIGCFLIISLAGTFEGNAFIYFQF